VIGDDVHSKFKRADKPLQTEVETSFNLKKIFDKVEDDKPVVENLEGKPKDDFTKDDLVKAWQEFLTKLQVEHKIPAYNALSSGSIELKDNFVIEFTFSSLSLSGEFDLYRMDLMRFFREKFNNYGIEFQVTITQGESKNFIKSKAELFKEMAEANPILLKMKEELGLDLNSND
jgi:hypothetical protein